MDLGQRVRELADELRPVCGPGPGLPIDVIDDHARRGEELAVRIEVARLRSCDSSGAQRL